MLTRFEASICLDFKFVSLEFNCMFRMILRSIFENYAAAKRRLELFGFPFLFDLKKGVSIPFPPIEPPPPLTPVFRKTCFSVAGFTPRLIRTHELFISPSMPPSPLQPFEGGPAELSPLSTRSTKCFIFPEHVIHEAWAPSFSCFILGFGLDLPSILICEQESQKIRYGRYILSAVSRVLADISRFNTFDLPQLRAN